MQKIIVLAALIDDADRILLIRRTLSQRYGGLWGFPGGKVEPRETTEAALIRELSEELSIDVRAHCLAPVCFASDLTDQHEYLLLLSVLRQWHGTIQPTEGLETLWQPVLRLGQLDMPPANQHLIAVLRDLI